MQHQPYSLVNTRAYDHCPECHQQAQNLQSCLHLLSMYISHYCANFCMHASTPGLGTVACICKGSYSSCCWRRYEDDSEDLEWDEVFNQAPMTDKTDVRGDWSTDALALLDGLAASPAKHRYASRKHARAATPKQSVGDTSQHHSQSSQAGPSIAFGISHESRSPQQHSNMSGASLSPGQAGGRGHQPPSQSKNGNMEMGQKVDNLHASGTADSPPFRSGQWQGAPAGPSMQQSGDDAWEGTGVAPQASPNKRRRTQEDGTAFGQVPSRKQHRDAPVARFTQVSQALQQQPAALHHSYCQCTSVAECCNILHTVLSQVPLHDSCQATTPQPELTICGKQCLLLLLLNSCCCDSRRHVLLLQVLQPGPGVGTSGQIAKVRLENFMCHGNLEIAFTYAWHAALVHSLQLICHCLM